MCVTVCGNVGSAGMITVPGVFFFFLTSLPPHIGLQYTLFSVSNHVI